MVILLVLLVPLIQDCHAAPFSSHPVTVCQELARFRPGSYLKFLAERIRCVQDHKTKPRIQFDLEEQLSRPPRFVTKVQINLCIWTWISNLFQEYKEVGKALTPLENNTWMANTVLQAAQLVHRKKREVEPEVQVSRMMHWLQTPLLHNQTILTPVKREPEAHDFDLESRNLTGSPWYPQIQVLTENEALIQSTWVTVIVITIGFSLACLVITLGDRKEKQAAIIIINEEPEEEALDNGTGTGTVIVGCETCDFHLEYPLLNILDKP